MVHQQTSLLSSCQRRSTLLASNTAADRKEVLAVYRSPPHTTMRARPKDSPKAPNSSFWSPGFWASVCVQTLSHGDMCMYPSTHLLGNPILSRLPASCPRSASMLTHISINLCTALCMVDSSSGIAVAGAAPEAPVLLWHSSARRQRRYTPPRALPAGRSSTCRR